jgi:exodeoxyribonuclease VII small subunit
MSDERSTFETTRARLEDIVTQVRRKDLSLEQSLDLLEEAVRLVNQCNDLVDQTSWRPEPSESEDEEPGAGAEGEAAAATLDADTEAVDAAGEVSEATEPIEAIEDGGAGEPAADEPADEVEDDLEEA